jgi:septum formation protein
MQLILGSQSPRRREVLSFFDLPFKQISPDFDEDSIPFKGDPKDYVKVLSKGKADSLTSQFPSSIILTADTIVYKDGKIYGKPQNEQEGFDYLKELCGNWHSVFTGLTISSQGKDFQAVEETRVLFNALTEEHMQTYHRMLHFVDKAGGYMIQGAGSLIVKRIEGCYYNVVGLPINALYSVFWQAGIDLWKHLKKV